MIFAQALRKKNAHRGIWTDTTRSAENQRREVELAITNRRENLTEAVRIAPSLARELAQELINAADRADERNAG